MERQTKDIYILAHSTRDHQIKGKQLSDLCIPSLSRLIICIQALTNALIDSYINPFYHQFCEVVYPTTICYSDPLWKGPILFGAVHGLLFWNRADYECPG